MQGESPLDMMRPQGSRVRRPRSAAERRRRRIWPFLVPAGIVILAAGWSWLWYHAASVADQTLSGWLEREAAAGRVYSCGSQNIRGFPFNIDIDCVGAAAKISSSQPPFAVSAEDVSFAAQVYHPTVLVGQVTGPLTLAEFGKPPSFVANWSRAQISVRGLPPQPDAVSVTLDQLRVDQLEGANNTMLFSAANANLQSRIIGGSASNNPVIQTTVQFTAAVAPTLHPVLTDPLRGEINTVLRGFKDLAPKRWSERFRELQAAGGQIEIQSLRIERADATILGTGTLTVDANGKLDGLLRVAIIGIENIVPLLHVDKLVSQGIDRLTGSSSPLGFSALDRLMPGLGDVVRDTANASVIDNIKKMGQQTEIDNKPATVLPLRFSDGSVYLGMVPLGNVPPLF